MFVVISTRRTKQNDQPVLKHSFDPFVVRVDNNRISEWDIKWPSTDNNKLKTWFWFIRIPSSPRYHHHWHHLHITTEQKGKNLTDCFVCTIKHRFQHGSVGLMSFLRAWPLPSAELSSWPVGHLSEAQVGHWTGCRGGESTQSFDLLVPWIGSNESGPAKLQWGSKDK